MKQCPGCGYKSREADEKRCPMCSALLIEAGASSACDYKSEKEWNNGYHNDFLEGRKTGEYCDPKFEKAVNGGEHYHNKTDLSTLSDLIPEKYRNFIAVFISAIISIGFPVLGTIISLSFFEKIFPGQKKIIFIGAILIPIIFLVFSFSFGFIKRDFNMII